MFPRPPLLPLHFLYGGITERAPLLLQVDTWHRRQIIRISSTLHAQLGVVGGGQADPSAPYQGTTFFISERNASDVTCLLAAVSLSYKTQSGFLPINQVRACGHDALFA